MYPRLYIFLLLSLAVLSSPTSIVQADANHKNLAKSQILKGRLKKVFFLMPKPQFIEINEISKSYFELFTAPKMELQLILNSAKDYESEIRHYLNKSKLDLYLELCHLPKINISSTLLKLKQEKRRQFSIWKLFNKYYRISVKSYLKEKIKANVIVPSLAKILWAHFVTLNQLEQERQKQIIDNWTLFFNKSYKEFSKSSAKKDALNKKPCSANLSFKGPKGALISPHALSLYRFLRLLPITERSYFLFQIYQPKFR